MSDESEKSDVDSGDQARHRWRMRAEWRDLMDDLIQAGQESGAFDNLPGKGQPLKLERNPFAADRELAHALLKENDLPPAWISSRNEILRRTDELRAEIERKWRWHQEQFAVAGPRRSQLTLSWDDAVQLWQAEITELNRKIRDFNLKRPSDRLELFTLTLDGELERAGAPRWLR